jgi:uncharacterized membrane protein YgaE (UPF0421/DUF939 family)
MQQQNVYFLCYKVSSLFKSKKSKALEQLKQNLNQYQKKLLYLNNLKNLMEKKKHIHFRFFLYQSRKPV